MPEGVGAKETCPLQKKRHELKRACGARYGVDRGQSWRDSQSRVAKMTGKIATRVNLLGEGDHRNCEGAKAAGFGVAHHVTRGYSCGGSVESKEGCPSQISSIKKGACLKEVLRPMKSLTVCLFPPFYNLYSSS